MMTKSELEVSAQTWRHLAYEKHERIEALEAERDALWETFIRVANMLDIDTDKARSAPGKPSDVFAAAIASRDAAMKAEGAKAIRHLTQGEDWEDDELRQVIDDCADEYRRQANQ